MKDLVKLYFVYRKQGYIPCHAWRLVVIAAHDPSRVDLMWDFDMTRINVVPVEEL